MSPRVVHFTCEEIVWECNSGFDCECGRLDVGDLFINRTFNKYHHLGDWPSDNPHTLTLEAQWGLAVGIYTSRNLTYDKDIFPALQGLAKIFAAAKNSDYLAGLWKDTLVCDLLWRINKAPQRRPKWRAPTWSWAAVSSEVCLEVGHRSLKILANATASVEPVGIDPFGELRSGRLIITGLAVKVRLSILNKNSAYIERTPALPDWPEGPVPFLGAFCRAHDVPETLYSADYDYSVRGPEFVPYGAKIELVLVAQSSDAHFFALVLKCVDENAQLFHRIARLHFRYSSGPTKKCSEPLGPFKDAETKTFTVI